MHSFQKRALWLLFSLLFLILPVGCRKAPVDPVDEPGPSPSISIEDIPDPFQRYDMALAYHPEEHRVVGTVTIDYINLTDAPLSDVPFSIYANAYQQEETAPFFQSEMGQAYPNGFSPGGIAVESATVDGKFVTTRVENEDDILLWVTLPQPLSVGERTEISLDVSITVPNSLGRFGYGEKSINLCNFYPIACVYQDGAFLTYPYYKAGDPFVSHVADYQVRFSAPSDYVVAHSGTLQKREEQHDGFTRYEIKGENIRDFALVLSREFELATQQVGDTLVASYSYKGQAQAGKMALNYTVKALQFMEEIGMPYPYGTLSTVQTDFFIGGMEYPTLTLIDQSLYQSGVRSSLEEVVVHEAIHQWFYAIVGNDQVMTPFLDEATTNYLTIKYFGHVYGKDQESLFRKHNLEEAAKLYENIYQPKKEDTRVGCDMIRYDHFGVYNLAIYINGARMYYEVEAAIGEEAMFQTLCQYYQTYQYQIATKENLLSVFQERHGETAISIFQKWL